jgi:plastocyanin
MSPIRRRITLFLLASCLSVGVLASSSVSAQEATEEWTADEVAFVDAFVDAFVETPEFLVDETTVIEFAEPAAELIVPTPLPELIVPTPVAEPSPSATPLPAPIATPAPASNPLKLAVAVIDNRFQPTALSIAPGTTVTWTNNGNNIHTLTSPDGLFDSGGLIGGATFSFTFDKAGSYRLICRQHGLNGMAGQIVVQ